MFENRSRWLLWRQALSQQAVWRRSLKIGLVVGATQILVNQGDHWWQGRVDAVVVVKTLITPLIAIGVALYSASGTYVQMKAERSMTDTPGMLK